jgi:PAS domain S-box-containing protein
MVLRYTPSMTIGMPKNLPDVMRKARIDLESALINSGLSISQQDLQLRYTQFVNTHPGMPQENLIGKTDDDWLKPSEAKLLTEIKQRALDGKQGVRELFKSTLNRGDDGDVYYNDIRVEPIMEHGKVVGIYTVAIDITEFQKALMKLEKLNGSLLEHMETMIGHKPDKREPYTTIV